MAGDLEMRVTIAFVVNGEKLRLGFQPDGVVTIRRTSLHDPNFPGALGDGFMGNGLLRRGCVRRRRWIKIKHVIHRKRAGSERLNR